MEITEGPEFLWVWVCWSELPGPSCRTFAPAIRAPAHSDETMKPSFAILVDSVKR